MKQKRVAAIHDISGFGKCSLTVALPIISSAGIEVSAIPTAVLSTHTGGIEGFTYRDLTEDMLPFANHWASLNLHFDAIYSGFLGSFQQIDIVSNIFDKLKTDDTLIMVDPCMADNGKLYSIYDKSMALGMTKLCAKADIIVPNLTEASFMLNKSYVKGPYTREYLENILRELSTLGCRRIVVTGVYFGDSELGVASYDVAKDEITYSFNKFVDGSFHGTGDIFASALLSAILNGFDLKSSSQIAVDFTYSAIHSTEIAKTDKRFGVNFEQNIPKFLKSLKLV